MNEPKFRNELEILINRHSMESGSNTPDWILADYLNFCLNAFDAATKARENFYGVQHKPGEAGEGEKK